MPGARQDPHVLFLLPHPPLEGGEQTDTQGGAEGQVHGWKGPEPGPAPGPPACRPASGSQMTERKPVFSHKLDERLIPQGPKPCDSEDQLRQHSHEAKKNHAKRHGPYLRPTVPHQVSLLARTAPRQPRTLIRSLWRRLIPGSASPPHPSSALEASEGLLVCLPQTLHNPGEIWLTPL